jgi:dihydropyrimidinase
VLACFLAALAVLTAGAPALADNLLIAGGTIVNAEGSQRADVRVRGETIAEVGTLEPENGERVIDASGHLVLPGGVDPHVHLAPIRDIFTFADDFESGSRAALAGGITSLGEMAFPNEGELPIATLERERALIEAQAIADVFVHTTVVEPSEAAIAGVGALVEAGQPSIKIFMNFETFESQEPSFLRLIERAGELGIRIAIHCEDIHTMEHVVNALEAEGKTSAIHYPASRPVFTEEIATQRAMTLAEMTGASLYVVHLSSARALNAVTAVRERLPVFVETRPIYLHLTEERYRGPDAGLFVGQPPIRSAADQRALWEGIAAGTVDTVASDHAPWTRAEKLDPANTIRHPRPGMNNLQVMLPMLYSEGVGRGKITLEHFVAVTATNAAKLFGDLFRNRSHRVARPHASPWRNRVRERKCRCGSRERETHSATTGRAEWSRLENRSPPGPYVPGALGMAALIHLRNHLVWLRRDHHDAADELSEVCELGEVHG